MLLWGLLPNCTCQADQLLTEQEGGRVRLYGPDAHWDKAPTGASSDMGVKVTQSPKLQVSPAQVRGGAAGGTLCWGHRGRDAKHRGRRVKLRKAGLGCHEGLCVHNTGVLSKS